jgi:excisionase family DNA binding protein
MSDTRLTLNVSEAGALLGVSRGTAYSLAKSGQIPVVRLGKRMLVPRAQFERLLAGQWTPTVKN